MQCFVSKQKQKQASTLQIYLAQCFTQRHSLLALSEDHPFLAVLGFLLPSSLKCLLFLSPVCTQLSQEKGKEMTPISLSSQILLIHFTFLHVARVL